MIIYQHENSSVPYNFDVVDYENFSYIPHVHRNPELVCVLRGEVRATVDESVQILHEGEFALILPNQVHGYETETESFVRVFVFGEEYVREFFSLLGDRVCKTNGFCLSEKDRSFFLDRMERSSDRMDRCACFYLVCGEFLRQKTEEGLMPAHERGELMHRMLYYITQYYPENITLRGAAEALGYEEHYLSRRFHACFGRNFKQFVNEYRLQHAERLLLDPNNSLSVTEIALASGFQSVRNFNRVYRAARNREPREIRSRRG